MYTMKNEFRKWLERNLPKSVDHYSSAINTINRICIDHDIPQLGDWTPTTFPIYRDLLDEIDEYTQRNLSGNNILKCALDNYEKFLEDFFNCIIGTLSDVEIKDLASSVKGKPSTRTVQVKVYNRNQFVVENAKRRADGFCELCKLPAPFKNKQGYPYLETHHIDWLSKGGDDTVDNTVALCPNCHSKMHVLDLSSDRLLLKKIMK